MVESSERPSCPGGGIRAQDGRFRPRSWDLAELGTDLPAGPASDVPWGVGREVLQCRRDGVIVRVKAGHSGQASEYRLKG